MAGESSAGRPRREEGTGTEGRRGGLGRAFDRLRKAWKRRGSSRGAVPATAAATTTGESRVAESRAERRTGASAAAIDAPSQPTDPSELLVADDGPIEVDDADEALLPMASFRNGIDEDTVKSLYEKHGLKYVPRRRPDASAPAAKMKRVEKPVRIRIHWTCHECKGQLAHDRTCVACGHRRCDECIRSPAMKAKEHVETNRELAQAGSSPEHATEPSASGPSNVVGLSLPTDLQVDHGDDGDDAEDDEVIKAYRYTMQVRPKCAEYLVLRPKTQIIRRQCHKCDTAFLPASRQECENCQHKRCSLCPRWPAKLDKWPRGSPGDEQPSPEDVLLVPAVQRVFKKPRQRVRYTCDQCQEVFLDRHICRNCGHSRCGNCSRYPPKKQPEYDPAVVQSVADRLAAHHIGEQPASPEVPAAAG